MWGGSMDVDIKKMGGLSLRLGPKKIPKKIGWWAKKRSSTVNRESVHPKTPKALNPLMSTSMRSKVRIGMAKDAFNKQIDLLTRHMYRAVKKEIIKFVIWSVALYFSSRSMWNMDIGETKLEGPYEKWISAGTCRWKLPDCHNDHKQKETLDWVHSQEENFTVQKMSMRSRWKEQRPRGSQKTTC